MVDSPLVDSPCSGLGAAAGLGLIRSFELQLGAGWQARQREQQLEDTHSVATERHIPLSEATAADWADGLLRGHEAVAGTVGVPTTGGIACTSTLWKERMAHG